MGAIAVSWKTPRSSAPGDMDHDDKGRRMMAVGFTTWGIAALFVMARFYTRARITRVLGWADWFILLSLIASLGMCVNMVVGIHFGLARQPSDVDPANMVPLSKTIWLGLLFYSLALGLTKISICLLYLTIFTLDWARRLSYAALIINVVHFVWVIIAVFTICIPLQAVWDISVKPTFSQPQEVWWANTGIAIFTDFAMCCIPIPFIGPLRLPRREKMVVVGIFALGFFNCIISLIRLAIVLQAQVSSEPNSTHYKVDLNYWVNIELNTAIVVACAMNLKPLVSKFFPNLLVSKTPDSSSGSPSGESGSGPQLTIGSKALKKQPSPARLSGAAGAGGGGGAYMEVADGENETREVALRDIEAQNTHPPQANGEKITPIIRTAEAVTQNNNDDGASGLMPVSTPFARSDTASVRTEELGPPTTARSIG